MQEPIWRSTTISFFAARHPFSGPPISASESSEGNGAYVHLPKQSSIGQEQQMKRCEVIEPASPNAEDFVADSVYIREF